MGYSGALGRGILLFWSCWLSVVFASNLADGLRAAGALPATWPFASGNFSLVRSTIDIYSLAEVWAVLLFGAVVATQLAASILFWRAALDRQAPLTPRHPKVVQAFAAAAGLFAGFLVADELFIIYDRFPTLESTHFLVFCALLLSLAVLSVTGDDATSA